MIKKTLIALGVAVLAAGPVYGEEVLHCTDTDARRLTWERNLVERPDQSLSEQSGSDGPR